VRILLTGKNGQVGWELQRSLCTLGEVVALGSAELDLADPDAIVRVVRELKPDLIVNPAAYTAVDKAESEPELAMAVNGRAPGILAEETKRLGALLVHYSTDYVFDGSKASPYVETDEPNPLNVYGRSKLEGERAIQAVAGRHLIFRTSWVYGTRGKNFLLTMSRLMRERQEVSVVSDQYGAATWSRYIAEATLQLLTRDVDGLLHLAAGSYWSWHEFAVAIREHLGATTDAALAEVIAIPSAEYPTPAQRPCNSCLDTKQLRTLGVHAPSSAEMLELALRS
jgi:dTDP-4-dehydrorhamnose reductase